MARLVRGGPGDGNRTRASLGVGRAGQFRLKFAVQRLGTAQSADQRDLVLLRVLVQIRMRAEKVVRDFVGRAAGHLFAVVAREQPRAGIGGLAVEVRGLDPRLRQEDRIVDDRSVSDVIAVPHEEFGQRGLVAFRKAVAAEPALLEVRGFDAQRVADERAGGEAHPSVRRVGRRMGPAVHPDDPVPFERLRVPMDGDQRAELRVALLPHPRVADGAHRIRARRIRRTGGSGK